MGNSPGVGVPARATIANSVTPDARIDIRPVLFATHAGTELRAAIKVDTEDAEFPPIYRSKVIYVPMMMPVPTDGGDIPGEGA